jgi:hypothetical protein
MDELKDKNWWGYIHEDLRELFIQAFLLMDIAGKGKDNDIATQKFHDYSFVVFPAAKAYEGFLKKLFLDLGLISGEDYYGRRFRIGRALNPALDRKLAAGESVYDKLVDYCNGNELADTLWETWKECRNLLFHWFPNEKNAITYKEARERVNRVMVSMDKVFEECRIER